MEWSGVYPGCPWPALAPPVKVALTVIPEHPCAYRPGRDAETRAFMTDRMPGGLYHAFMDAGFRRSGKMIYQPICRGCRACVPIRVPVEGFRPSKSQRRCVRRNEDLTISMGEPAPTEEKFALYQKYLAARHVGPMSEGGWESFESFLYDTPVDTAEMCYRDGGGRLVGVGICDVSGKSLSSVYFYFDPDEAKRGLGTFSAVAEIQMARSMDIPHYYLGYWVEGCETMDYKRRFRPCEVLGPEGQWHLLEEEKADQGER